MGTLPFAVLVFPSWSNFRRMVIVALLILESLSGSVVAQTRLCNDYTPTVDGGHCKPTDTECEFKLVATKQLTLTKPDGSPLLVDDYKVYSVLGQPPLTEDELKDVIVADGAIPYIVVDVLNNTLPGPCLTIFKGQKVTVHVTNELINSALSLHWHGLDQYNNSYMDGVEFVTQCPLLPGQSFTYTFSPSRTGSYWYHSHVGEQPAMGIYGPLIVLDPDTDSLPHDEHVIVLQDWNHDVTSDHMDLGVFELKGDRMVKHGRTHSLDGAKFSSFPYHSGLINGRGRYYSSMKPVEVKFKAPLEVFPVASNRVYRFRVISAASNFPFRVSVQGHRIEVVASDGHDFEGVSAESFVIHPGERYDFLLTTNQTAGSYMILAKTLEEEAKHVAEAVLRYDTAPDTDLPEPYLPDNSIDRGCGPRPGDKCVVVNCPFRDSPGRRNGTCVNLRDLKAKDDTGDTAAPLASPEDIKETFLNLGMSSYSGKTPAINGIVYQNPPVAAILRPNNLPTACGEGCGKENVTCTCTHILPLTRGAVHQIVLTNIGTGRGFSHPIHIHGHSYYVLKQGYPSHNPNGHIMTDNADVECLDEFCNVARWRNESWRAETGGEVAGLNLLNPARKDTIIVPTGGYVVTRVVAKNPGLWFMHCHIEMHLLGGMALFLEDREGMADPPPDFPTCDNFPSTLP